MKKTLLALCMILTIFISSTSTSFAAVCPNPNAPSGAHDFSDHKNKGGIVKDLGNHQYLYGYDEYHTPMYRTCHITQVVEYCIFVCKYCGLENSGGSHSHEHDPQHSVSH